MKRTWLGGVALVAVFGFAACSDDDGTGDTPSAGAGGKSSGGSAGSTHGGGDGGAPTTAGSSSGGKGGNVSSAGKAGMATGGTAAGGTDMGPGGEGGVGVSGGAGGAGGLGGEGGDSVEDIRKFYAGMSPLPAVPGDLTNNFADNAAAAALGQKLFFDEKLSGLMTITNDLGTKDVDSQKVSCNSCHSGPALDDERSSPNNISQGTGLHSRNAPGMVNSSFYTWTNWGGRFAAQWELPPAVLENKAIMNGSRLALAHRIYDAYKADYEAVFGNLDAGLATVGARFPATGKPKPAAADPDGAWEAMAADDKLIVNRILANFGKALQAYTRKLVSREAKFDAWMAGDDSAFTASQLNGAKLFHDNGCLKCHNGATFSDQDFHDLGVPQTGPGVLASDDGRFKDLPGLLNSTMNVNSQFSDKTDTGKLAGLSLPPPDALKGVFRTPSLRGVAQSGPYMHSGQFATLDDVINFYAVGGTLDTSDPEVAPFTITPQEKADLIAFLGTLTGKAVPDALLVDTAPN
jgi:cytochrome c peroxidase